MPDVRYMGKHHWTQTVLTDEGKFKEFKIVAPGEVVTVDEQAAERFLQGPRDSRLFVAAGSSEDPSSKDYVRSKWDTDIIDSGNYVSQDVGREYGSTTPDGQVLFRTEDDNEENYPVAPPGVGAQSDNARLYEEDEIQAEAEEARRKARESRSSKRASSSTGSSSSSTTGGDPPPTSSPRHEGGQS